MQDPRSPKLLRRIYKIIKKKANTEKKPCEALYSPILGENCVTSESLSSPSLSAFELGPESYRFERQPLET